MSVENPGRKENQRGGLVLITPPGQKPQSLYQAICETQRAARSQSGKTNDLLFFGGFAVVFAVLGYLSFI